jgi:hypothetical protein
VSWQSYLADLDATEQAERRRQANQARADATTAKRAAEFVRDWNDAKSLSALSLSSGKEIPTLIAKANLLREQGHNLKHLPDDRPPKPPSIQARGPDGRIISAKTT